MFHKPLDISLVLKWSGLSQYVFLKKTHISVERFQAYQSGEQSVSLEDLISISQLLEVSFDGLYTLEEGEKKERTRDTFFQEILVAYQKLQYLKERQKQKGEYQHFLDKVSMRFHPPILGFCGNEGKLLVHSVYSCLGADSLSIFEFLSSVKKPVYLLPDFLLKPEDLGQRNLIPFEISRKSKHIWDTLENSIEEAGEKGYHLQEILENNGLEKLQQQKEHHGYLLFLPIETYPLLKEMLLYYLPPELQRGVSGSKQKAKIGAVDYGEMLLHQGDVIFHVGSGTFSKEELPQIHRLLMSRFQGNVPLGHEVYRGYGVFFFRKQEEGQEIPCSDVDLLCHYMKPQFWRESGDWFSTAQGEAWLKDSMMNTGEQHSFLYTELISAILDCYWKEIMPSSLLSWMKEERKYLRYCVAESGCGQFFAFLDESAEEKKDLLLDCLYQMKEIHKLFVHTLEILSSRNYGEDILFMRWDKVKPYDFLLDPMVRDLEKGSLTMLPVHMDVSSLLKTIQEDGFFWRRIEQVLEKSQSKLSIFQEDYAYLQELGQRRSKEAKEARAVLEYLDDMLERERILFATVQGEKHEMYRLFLESGKHQILVVDGKLKSSLQEHIPPRSSENPLMNLRDYVKYLSCL